MRTRAIYGCAGLALSADERAFFRETQPAGFILFARNVKDPTQVTELIEEMRETVGNAKALVLIDQEGGRVARLKPPHWKVRPPGQRFADLYGDNPEAAKEAAYLNARLMAHELAALGINVDCVPVLDVPVDGADQIIGDRAYGRNVASVIDLGRAVIDGMMDGGVLPVMKHIPGHGRANVDSHAALPHVDTDWEDLSTTDFMPFRSLNHCPLAMTAHVVYEAIDTSRPATTSPRLIRDVIRGEIGFGGLLLSDDVSMQALTGSIGARTKAALFAGCDVALHCNGKMDEMKDVAGETGPLEGASAQRFEAAMMQLVPPSDLDVEAGETRLTELLGAMA